VINTNLTLVRQSVTKAATSFDQGAAAARDEMMDTLIQLTKEEIKGERPYTDKTGRNRKSVPVKDRVYDKATDGEPPMTRTGTLRRSIHGQKTDKGFSTYSAIIGPGVVYGRALELGGEYAPANWGGKRFPYMSPAFQKFKVVAPAIIRKHIGKG
jgi:hypothetical protein